LLHHSKPWEEHLKALGDRELAELAKDYNWLDEEAQAQEQGQEIIAAAKL
jgi:hypothetical protein